MSCATDDYVCQFETNFMKAISIYALCVTVLGTLFNTTSFFFCRTKKHRYNSTFLILSFIFPFEVLSLYTWNLNIFLQILPKHHEIGLAESNTINDHNIIESTSIATCKIFTFSQFFSLQTISWLLVYMALDQVLRIYYPSFKFNQIRTTFWVSIIIVATLFLINSHILLFVGYIKHLEFNRTILVNNKLINQTISIQKTQCYASLYYEFYPTWDRIHLGLFCFVPFFLMLVCNIFLIKRIIFSLRKSHTSNNNTSKSTRKKRKMSVFILIYSFMFMICTMPQIVLFSFYFDSLTVTKYGKILLYLSDELTFSFIAFNFLLINKLFRKKIIKFLRGIGYDTRNSTAVRSKSYIKMHFNMYSSKVS